MARSTTTDVDAQIGATIRTLRIGQRMTQAELAREIGVTFQQVQKYECGVNRVSAATLLKLAETLDCSVAHLYGEPEVSSNTKSERAILKLWEQLHDQQRDAVVVMIQEFLKR